jgi:hypothetical protein
LKEARSITSSSSTKQAIILFEERKVACQIIFSNVKELVEQEQYTFDIFWSKAIPAQDKIKESEENISIHRTQIIYGHENTTDIACSI